MKKTLTKMIVTSMIALGTMGAVTGCSDLTEKVERMNMSSEETRKHDLLISAVKEKYNTKAENNNSDENRSKNYNWEFYDLTDMPPRNDKVWRFRDSKYNSGNGVGKSVLYINDNTAIVGVKNYLESFTGDVKRNNYAAEKYVFVDPDWKFVNNYHKCVTNSKDIPISTSTSLFDKVKGYFNE
ncbi:MAG: hypothetical protein WC755_00725 [Candidatus Woesearchaeota archaeon]|jgi:hypothetical protein